MAEVTLSNAVRNNLLSLQNTADLLGKTQQRLSTGLKVNSALDDPSAFFTASALNSRAGDLNRLLDSVGNSVQTLRAADNGLSAITKLVENAQATARQALQTTGAVTSNSVVGSSAATYSPEALASVTGDNSGNGALTADAAATLSSNTIAADADIAVFTSDVVGDGTLLSAGGAGTFADGDSLVFTVNGSTKTVTFDADTVADLSGTDTLTIGVDQTIDALGAALTTLFGSDTATGITVARAGGAGITFTSDATTDSVVVADGQGGATLAKLGLELGDVGAGIDISSGSTVGDFLLSRNATIGALAAAGTSLNTSVGTTAQSQITFGGGSTSTVATKEQLIAALDGLAGVSATGNAADGSAITINNATATDADSSIVLTGSNAATATALFTGTDGGSTTVQTTAATNLLSQGAVSQGETLDIKVGSAAALTITFGTGSNQVSTLAELNTELQGLNGGAASANGDGEINITADKADDTIVIGGSAAPLTSFGLTADETGTLVDGTNLTDGDVLSLKIGTNTQLDITFGTDPGQVNTVAELETALGNLAGGTAEIDDSTGAITVTATIGTDDITITSTDNVPASKDSVAASFGLTNSSSPVTSSTVDSTVRANLESQFNELLVQINDIVQDASFNGVNLLNGSDLKVLFNEDGSSSLSIDGVTFDSSGLGLSKVSSGQFQTDGNVNNALEALKGATSLLRTQSSNFGSNLSVVEVRQNFTKNLINTLETGAANLTLADTNEEGANTLALQTRQQLSSVALSLASQADQNVLRLF